LEWHRSVSAVAIAAGLCGPVEAFCGNPAGEARRVMAIVDGDTIALSEGMTVRLAGIEAPKRLPGHAEAKPQSAERARAALESYAGAAEVTVEGVGAERDRYGRLPSLVWRTDGKSLQELLLESGNARVRGPVPAGCLAYFLGFEEAARAQQKGMWQDGHFAVRDADDPSLRAQKGLYEVVEGRVASVGRRAGVVFLNFGRNWQRDFTVMVAPALASIVAGGESSIDSLAGKRLRVRGVVEENGGALIRVSDPSGIEVLER
jgi:endonuclease YncB( thermonuclease family)